MSLKVGVIWDPIIATQCALDQVCDKRGYMIDAMRLICDYSRLNCSFFWYNDSYGNADENGVGTELVGAIQRGEFDTSLPGFTPTFSRFKAIDFGEPFDVADGVLMTRAPKLTVETNLNWSVISAFQWPLWIAFLFSLLLVACFLSLASRYERNNSFAKEINNFFDLLTSLITNDFKDSWLRLNSFRFLVGVWLFVGVILTSAYSSILFANKVSTNIKLPFTNLETFVECLESSRCQLVYDSFARSSLLQLLSPTNTLGARIQKSFVYNPAFQMKIWKEIPNAILEEKNRYLVLVVPKDHMLYFSSGNSHCHYYTVDMHYAEFEAFPFAKNSSYSKTLNRMTSSFREFGLLQVLKKKYLQESTCDHLGDVQSSKKGQTLASMATAFCFYFLSIVLAVAAFLIETLTKRILDSQNGCAFSKCSFA